MKKALLLVAASFVCAAPALADLALATSKNCMSCHAVDRKVLGLWGPVPMPANNQVSEADAKKLAAWVLSTK